MYMKKRLLLQTALLMLVSCLWAQGPNNSKDYYQAADGMSGSALQAALGNIISNHKNIGYDGLWNAYKTTDKRADGKVRDWYSCKTNYVFDTDKAGSYSKEGDCYNREHTVPQSWFNESAPMKADVVHVVPTDGWVNGIRSSFPYAKVDPASVKQKDRVYNDYCMRGTSTTPGYSGTAFEPNDEIKGDLARIYFYMATCYYSQCGNWSGGIFKSRGLVQWTMDLMMEWSKQDPIDDIELARNEAVKSVQGNRNPFVDYPGLEEYIWGDKQDVIFSYDNYNSGETYAVAKPTFDPIAGTYYNSVEVTLSCNTEGASIFYTLNGEDASEQSTLYEGPITLDELGTYEIKAVAIKDGDRSAQASATYIIAEPGGGGGGGDVTPVDGEMALNNSTFNTGSSGVINSSSSEDLTYTQNGITVTYALGTGSQRYANDSHIRLYQGNTLTVSVAQGTLTEIEFVTLNTSKQLEASVGTVSSYTWSGNTSSVTFNVNSGSGNLQVSKLNIKVNGPSGPSDIELVQTNTRLDGQRVIYDLSGRRVVNPTSGIYIVDGRKVVIK